MEADPTVPYKSSIYHNSSIEFKELRYLIQRIRSLGRERIDLGNLQEGSTSRTVQIDFEYPALFKNGILLHEVKAATLDLPAMIRKILPGDQGQGLYIVWFSGMQP